MNTELLQRIRTDRSETLLDTIETHTPYYDTEWFAMVKVLVNRMVKLETRISLRNRQIRDLRRELHRSH